MGDIFEQWLNKGIEVISVLARWMDQIDILYKVPSRPKTHWEKRAEKFVSTCESCLKEGNKQTNKKISTSLGGN